jgi:RNA polymerase sigma factor (sigma-70 family)
MKMDASPAEAPQHSFDELYRRCREPLHARSRIWFPTLRGCEEDLYQAAWASLLGNSRTVEDPEKFLETAVYSAGLKELRRRRRRPIVSLSFARFRSGASARGTWEQGVEALADRTEPLPEEQVESREDAMLLAELLEELTPLQRRIIKLRWGLGLRRREAAALLGISEKTLKREMEKAEPMITANAELARAGRWCEPKASLVVAYSLGLLGERRAAKARDHLQRCAGCRAVARAMHDRLEDLAAVLPLPALAASASSHGLLGRAVELGDSVRMSLSGLGRSAKEDMVALVSRAPAVDTAATQVAAGGGLRGGGSALAAVTACLIAGGGATYCAIEGVPESLRTLAPIERAKEGDDRGDGLRAPQKQAAPLTERQPPAASPGQPDSVNSDGRSTEPAPNPSNGETTDAQASPAPTGSAEFDAAADAPKRRAPALAPPSGGEEFTP